MAEIKRTLTSVTESSTTHDEPKARTTEHVEITSIWNAWVDVATLRDLLAAADKAGAPGKAMVTANLRHEGRIASLSIAFDVEQAAPAGGDE